MPDTPSFQDLLADFSEEIFVGRSEQLALFEQALTAPRPPFLILDVSGQGGVGKTTLLEQFRHLAKRGDVLTALVNEDHTTIPTVLSTFAKHFSEAGQPCKTFDERYKKYRELKDQVEADPKAPSGMLDFALRSVTRIGFRAIKKRVPLAEEASDVLLSPDVEDVIAEQTSAFANYVAQKFSNKDERVLLLETDTELTRHLLTDLNKQAENGRIVLFFDTFEKTASTLENWLIDLLNGKFGSFSGNVLFVIAGRYPLSQSWMKFKRAIRQVELQEFTEAEARDYLARNAITDEKQIASLIQLSNRLPVLLALLVSAPGEVPSDVSGDAVERFLQGATSEQREAALVASVPRFFNQDILTVILGPEKAKAAFEWLSEAHFVRSSERGWVYHDVVRALMLWYFRMRSAQQCSEIHAKLANNSKVEAVGLAAAQKGLLTNEMWRRAEVEHLYHSLSANPSEEIAYVVEEVLKILFIFFEAANFSIKQTEGIKALWDEIPVVFKEVLRETKHSDIQSWLDCLEHIQSDMDDTKAKQQLALIVALLDRFEASAKYAHATTFLIRAAVATIDSNYDLAVAESSNAIELLPENTVCYLIRALVKQELDDHTAALADFNKAVELQPDSAITYFGRGRTHYDLKNYPAALADFTKAVELQPDDGDNYYWRGHTHRDLKDYPAALADFNKAIELQPDDGDNYRGRGRTHYDLKDFPAALADFNKAVELRPDNGYGYARRGCTFIKLNELQEGRSDFARAESLLNEEGRPAYIAASGYADLGDANEACIWLRRAFERDKELSKEALTDPDFEPICETSEFKALMAEFDKEI